jgi:cobalt-zinc-cadmium efflux system outer membrane protein
VQFVQFGETRATIIADTFRSWCAGLNAPSEENSAMRMSNCSLKAALAGLAFAFGVTGEGLAQDAPVTRAVPALAPHDPSAHNPRAIGTLPTPAALPATPRPATAPTVPPGALELADFERIALEHNPTLRQAFAQLDATLSRSNQAGLYPNPTVGYVQEQIGAIGEVTPTSSGIATKGRGTPGELVGGFVQQEFVTGGKLRFSRAKFAEEAEAARWQCEAQRLRVLNGVRVRFFEVLTAQRLFAIQREMLRLNDDAVRTTEQLVNVGQANEPDLLQARIEARRARVALRKAENRYRGSWQHLVSVVGAPELHPTPLDDGLLDAAVAPLDFDATLADLLRHSPEIQASLAEIRRSQIMVQRERREPIPNVTVQAIVGRNFEFNNLTTAGVQVSIPLPIFNRNQWTVQEAMSDLTRDHAEYERVALSIRQRLADEAVRYNDARQSVEDFRTESLPMARRAFEVQSANFRQRRAAWPQVLVVQRTLVELTREYVEALSELRRAEVVIDGMLLIDGLSPPNTPTPQGHIESVPTPR